ncbi:MAG: hypothetical protein WD399_07255 [Thermoleophilaceae bacterium]
MTGTLEIPSRFNGPLDSGNGGYSAGALARFVDGSAEVTLRRPVPLARPLDVRREDDGRALAVAGDEVIAEARAAPDLEIDVPAPITVDEARAARGRYRGAASGPFSRCFVCGRAREDSLDVKAGAVEGRHVVASPWVPPAWAGDESGAVRPEIVWAVLDCPTYFAAYIDAPEPLPPAVLGRLSARIDAPVPVGEEHVAIAWPIAAEGRKREAGVALLSAAGDVLAAGRALLIEPRPQ